MGCSEQCGWAPVGPSTCSARSWPPCSHPLEPGERSPAPAYSAASALQPLMVALGSSGCCPAHPGPPPWGKQCHHPCRQGWARCPRPALLTLVTRQRSGVHVGCGVDVALGEARGLVADSSFWRWGGMKSSRLSPRRELGAPGACSEERLEAEDPLPARRGLPMAQGMSCREAEQSGGLCLASPLTPRSSICPAPPATSNTTCQQEVLRLPRAPPWLRPSPQSAVPCTRLQEPPLLGKLRHEAGRRLGHSSTWENPGMLAPKPRSAGICAVPASGQGRATPSRYSYLGWLQLRTSQCSPGSPLHSPALGERFLLFTGGPQ